MKAMILAAGRGERLGEITKTIPKPLLDYQGYPLIVHRLRALRKAGIEDVIINVWYHAEKIQEVLGDGSQWNLRIHYSVENELLNTGGGIQYALPLLGDEPFILTNSDLVTDFDYGVLNSLPKNFLAHLVLINNPAHHPEGDFCLDAGKVSLKKQGESSFTYSGIALLSPLLFMNETRKVFPLTDVLNKAIHAQQVSGEYYPGGWVDVGRPDDLHRARELADHSHDTF